MSSHNDSVSESEIWIEDKNFTSTFCQKGCGLFMVQNNQFYLRGILTLRTESHLIFHDVLKFNNFIQEITNITKRPELIIPAIKKYNSNQVLRRFHFLVTDECLNAGEDMVSLQKNFALSFRKDGILMLIDLRSSTIIWQSGSTKKNASKLCLREFGDLLLIDNKNQTIIKLESNLRASKWMQVGDDAIVAIYDVKGTSSFVVNQENLGFSEVPERIDNNEVTLTEKTCEKGEFPW